MNYVALDDLLTNPFASTYKSPTIKLDVVKSPTLSLLLTYTRLDFKVKEP